VINARRDTICFIPEAVGASPSVSLVPTQPLIALGGTYAWFGSNTGGLIGDNSFKSSYLTIPQVTVRPLQQAAFGPYAWSMLVYMKYTMNKLV